MNREPTDPTRTCATPHPAAFGWFAILLVYLSGILYAIASGAAERITAAAELPIVLSAALALFLILVLQIVVIIRRGPFSANQGFLVFLIPPLFAVLGFDYMPSRGHGGGIVMREQVESPELGLRSPRDGGWDGGWDRGWDMGPPVASSEGGSTGLNGTGSEGRDTADSRLGTSNELAGADRIEERSPSAPASPEAWFGSAVKAPIPETGTIELDARSYYDLYNQIYDDMHALEGRTIMVDGFVHFDTSFAENELLVGRMLMWCCAADAVLLGFMSRLNGQALPSEDAWVTVTGSIELREFTNPHTGEKYEIPYVQVESISPTERPQFEYVFPF